MEHDLKKARNLKLILLMFEQLLGAKINFHKSSVLARPKMKPKCMPRFFAAARVNFLLGIWVFQFTIGDLLMLNRKLWRRDYNYG
jgi:hypothetical protein